MRKRLSVLFLLCALFSVFVCGCAQKTEEPTEYIGIISAMDNFEKVYGKRADKRRKLSNGGMPCTFYQYFPQRFRTTED